MQNFKGIESLKEVRCSGIVIASQIESLSSITLFEHTSDNLLIHLQALPSLECKTFASYSSCHVNQNDFKLSSVKTLISNLKEEESIKIGFNVSTFEGFGKYKQFSWIQTVYRESKILILIFTMFFKIIL